MECSEVSWGILVKRSAFVALFGVRLRLRWPVEITQSTFPPYLKIRFGVEAKRPAQRLLDCLDSQYRLRCRLTNENGKPLYFSASVHAFELTREEIRLEVWSMGYPAETADGVGRIPASANSYATPRRL